MQLQREVVGDSADGDFRGVGGDRDAGGGKVDGEDDGSDAGVEEGEDLLVASIVAHEKAENRIAIVVQLRAKKNGQDDGAVGVTIAYVGEKSEAGFRMKMVGGSCGR